MYLLLVALFLKLWETQLWPIHSSQSPLFVLCFGVVSVFISETSSELCFMASYSNPCSWLTSSKASSMGFESVDLLRSFVCIWLSVWRGLQLPALVVPRAHIVKGWLDICRYHCVTLYEAVYSIGFMKMKIGSGGGLMDSHLRILQVYLVYCNVVGYLHAEVLTSIFWADGTCSQQPWILFTSLVRPRKPARVLAVLVSCFSALYLWNSPLGHGRRAVFLCSCNWEIHSNSWP